MNKSASEKAIRRFRTDGSAERLQDFVAVEAPLQLSISQRGKQRNVAITMRTPGADDLLALGFLLTEGILPPDLDPKLISTHHIDERHNHLLLELPDSVQIDWQRLSRHSYTSSSCGVCGKTSIELVFQTIPWAEMPDQLQVSSQLISTLPDQLRKQQNIFALTGGIHGSGLFSSTGDLEAVFEDVGRHNSADKLIGKLWMSKRLPCIDSVLVLSGRASFELLQKAAMAGIKFIVSVGAPSTLAVDLAQELGITLCGFVKRDQFNCYAGFHRILSA